jgi:peroxiredoxin
MKLGTKVLVLSAAVAVAAACAGSGGFAALSKNTKAPDFRARTVTGKQLALSDLRGRVVLLDFWATWCPPCRLETPELQKLWQKYRDKGLVVIGISLDQEGAPVVRRFADDHKLTYWQVSDAQGEIADKYGIRPIPTTYVVDTKGVIQYVQVGFGPGVERELAKRIEALLPSPKDLKKLKPLTEQPAK